MTTINTNARYEVQLAGERVGEVVVGAGGKLDIVIGDDKLQHRFIAVSSTHSSDSRRYPVANVYARRADGSVELQRTGVVFASRGEKDMEIEFADGAKYTILALAGFKRTTTQEPKRATIRRAASAIAR
jgi:hypothetical protein